MKRKKISILFYSLLLLFSLAACGEETEDAPETAFSVSLQSTAGTGYYWDCSLSDSRVVSVVSEQETTASPLPGSSFTTNFFFTGKKSGTATASFCCSQSWDDSVCYLRTCELTVDRDKTVTGELSGPTARIRPGEGLFKLAASDTSVALWIEEEDGSYTFTPLRNGSTTLTFTSLNEDEPSCRVFHLSVAEDGELTVTEDTGLTETESYSSLADLEEKVGFPMPLPEGSLINELCSVGTMAYVNFTREETEFAYTGGDLDLNAFITANTDIRTISGYTVVLQTDAGATAAWEKSGTVYCITSEAAVSAEALTALLEEMLRG